MILSRVLPVTACLLAGALASFAVSPPVQHSVEDLVDPASRAEGRAVSLLGEVKEINYRPQIIKGTSIYSFQLTDGTGTIRVLSQLATYFSPGDVVRVEGIYIPADTSSGRPAQIDATEGVIEVTEAAESELAKMFNRDPMQLMAVPTSVTETSWSRADKLASVLSATFALVAAVALLLRSRRFNVGLNQVLVRGTWGGSDTLILVVRVASTHSLAPLVSERADLYIKGVGGVAAASITPLGSNRAEARVFPLPVTSSALLELRFPGLNPKTLPADYQGTLVFQDAPTSRKFRQRISLDTQRISADQLFPGLATNHSARRVRAMVDDDSPTPSLRGTSHYPLETVLPPKPQWLGLLILGFALVALAMSQIRQRSDNES